MCMSRSARFLGVLALSFLACASIGCATPLKLKPGQQLPPGEIPLVGRVKLMLRGAPVKWGDGGLFHGSWLSGGNGYFKLIVSSEDNAKQVYEDTLTHDGTFVWRLPRGRYRVVAFNWEILSYPYTYSSSARVGAIFTVDGDDPIYLGTLVVDLDAEKPDDLLRMEDDTAVAEAVFRDRFPKFGSNLRHGIMELEKDP